MTAMTQARGIFYAPGRFMRFTSAIANGIERSRVRRSAKRPLPAYDPDAWRTESMQGMSAADEAARFISSGRLW
ncbi:MAG: hypothetical protein V3R95_06090 [Dehalococcoidia bacterium]